MRPAATLSMPTKRSRGALGRSETSATTASPSSFSRATASRTCGVSGAMIATPSSRRGFSARSARTTAWGSCAGVVTTLTEARSATWVAEASSRAARRVSTNWLGPSGSTKARR